MDLQEIFAMRNALAQIGFERLPEEVIEAENRLLEKGIRYPTLRQYLIEVIGEEEFEMWARTF